MTAAPLDLRAWQRVDPPKYKKDYPGKMLRVHNPTREDYERVDGVHRRVRKPDAVLPPGAVLHLRQRYTNGIDSEGKSRAILVCDWHCPCCGRAHERQIPETALDEGNAEFVEESDLDQAIRPVVYLASPYSHPDPAVRQDRWLQNCAAAVWLAGKGSDSFDDGYVVYAPICMGHPISVVGAQSGLGHDAAAWERHNTIMLEAATHMVILRLDGVPESEGVAAEIAYARKKGLPLYLLDQEEDGYRLHLLANYDLNGQCHEEK